MSENQIKSARSHLFAHAHDLDLTGPHFGTCLRTLEVGNDLGTLNHALILQIPVGFIGTKSHLSSFKAKCSILLHYASTQHKIL